MAKQLDQSVLSIRTFAPGWLGLRYGGWDGLEDLLTQHGGIDEEPSLVTVSEFNWRRSDADRLWSWLGRAADNRVRVAGRWIAQTYHDLSLNAHVVINPRRRLTLEAEIAPGLVIPFRTRLRARGLVNFGTVLALDDMAMSLAAATDFLRIRDGEKPKAWAAIADLGIVFPGRYVDYRHARLERSAQVLGYLSRYLPLQMSRLGVGIAVSELGLAWITAHEIAHDSLGHFNIVGRFGVTKMRMGDGPGAAAIAADDKEALQCLEMQADYVALVVVMAWSMADNAAENYPFLIQQRLRDLDSHADLTGVPSPDNAFDRARATLVAAAGALMALEHRTPFDGRGIAEHPDPASRIFSLMMTADSFLRELETEDARDFPTEARKLLLQEAMQDIDMVSRILGVADPVYRLIDEEGNQTNSSLFEDVWALIDAGNGETPTMKTEAGRVYLRLVARSEELGLSTIEAMEKARRDPKSGV